MSHPIAFSDQEFGMGDPTFDQVLQFARGLVPSVFGSYLGSLYRPCPDCRPVVHCPPLPDVRCSVVHCNCGGNVSSIEAAGSTSARGASEGGVSWSSLLWAVVIAVGVGFAIGCCVGAALGRRRSTPPRREALAPPKVQVGGTLGLRAALPDAPAIERRLPLSLTSSPRTSSCGSSRDEAPADAVWKPRRR